MEVRFPYIARNSAAASLGAAALAACSFTFNPDDLTSGGSGASSVGQAGTIGSYSGLGNSAGKVIGSMGGSGATIGSNSVARGSSSAIGNGGVGGSVGIAGTAGTDSSSNSARGGAASLGGAINTGGSTSSARGGTTGLGGTINTGASSGSARAGASASGGAINTGGSSSAARGGAAVSGGSTGVSGSAGSGNAGRGGTTAISSPNGQCSIPATALAESVASPTTVIGTGSAASCTSAAVVAAVAKGGIITFNCGPSPVTISMLETANVYNQVNNVDNDQVVIDGGGMITLDGGGARRILYQNTCDEKLVWATASCDQQSFPKLVLQNITIANGNGASSSVATDGLSGGGAIYVEGGTFKTYNLTVTNSKESHPAGELAQNLAGGAVYLYMLSEPAYIVNSTFQGNSATNGGALGMLHTSAIIFNSVFSGNSATGHGRTPAQSGTTGGGLGGAIFNIGETPFMLICGTAFANNTATELGSGAIYHVVFSHQGDLVIDSSAFVGNSNDGNVQSHASIYVEARDTVGNAGVSITNCSFN